MVLSLLELKGWLSVRVVGMPLMPFSFKFSNPGWCTHVQAPQQWQKCAPVGWHIPVWRRALAVPGSRLGVVLSSVAPGLSWGCVLQLVKSVNQILQMLQQYLIKFWRLHNFRQLLRIIFYEACCLNMRPQDHIFLLEEVGYLEKYCLVLLTYFQYWSVLLKHAFVCMIKMQGLLPFPAAHSSSEAEANQQCRDKRRLNSKWVQSVSASIHQKGNLKSMKPL